MVRRISLVSASVLVSLGLGVTGFALGWSRPTWTPPWLHDSLNRWSDVPAVVTREADLPQSRGQMGVVADAAQGRREPPMVRLDSEEVVRQVGIETATATEVRHTHQLVANAEAAYDTRRYATVSPRVVGFLREVRVDLGQVVRQGEILAVVDSAEISAAKTQLLTALAATTLAQATFERTAVLARSGQMAARTELESRTALNQAKAALADAEQRLRNLGLGDEAIGRVREPADKSSMLNVVAPIDGTVVLLRAVQGEAVQPTAQLFAIADTRRMWLWIDVYESDIGQVFQRQAVNFVISGTASPTLSGEVTWVGTEVNPTTRTTRVRAELANPEGRLRANQFGKASLHVGVEHRAVVIPESAVQRLDGDEVVFLPQGGSAYRAQRVKIRPTDQAGMVEVVDGLQPGERIVTGGAYRLKSELERDAIVE